jgi:hypothetical protein
MKKVFTLILILFSVLFASVLTPNAKAAETRVPQITSLSKNQIVNKDYFAGGEIVEIYGTVNGDAYIGGGQVTVDGIINGDLLVGGGQIKITGKVLGNIRVAGGQVDITGATVGKNITAVGGDIEIGNTTKVLGSVVMAGGNLNMFSDVGKGLAAAGGNIAINGNIKNDVEVAGEVIRLMPTANILGKLDYWSKNDVIISDGSQVKGTTYRHDIPTYVTSNQLESFRNGAKTGVNTAGYGIKLFGFLSFLIVGLIISKLFPEFSVRVSESILKNPWKMMGIGFLVVILTPIVFIALLITILGIPLAFVSLSLYMVFTYICKYFVMLTVGELALNKLNQKHSIYYSFLVGLLIYTLLTAVPLLGGLVKFGFLLAGIGSLAFIFKNQLSSNLK